MLIFCQNHNNFAIKREDFISSRWYNQFLKQNFLIQVKGNEEYAALNKGTGDFPDFPCRHKQLWKIMLWACILVLGRLAG